MEGEISALSMPHRQRLRIVAQRIKKARLDSGLTQMDIANQLGISQPSYSRVEAGRLEPSAVQIVTLSGLFGVSVLWLLGYPNYIALTKPER